MALDNFLLRITHPYLVGTKTYQGLPLLDSPLWTLFYEFLCYLLVAVLSTLGLLRRPPIVALLAVATWVTAWIVGVGQHQWQISFDVDAMLTLVPVFLTGTLVYLYRDDIPDSGWFALGAVGVVALSPFLPIGRTEFGPLAVSVPTGSSRNFTGPVGRGTPRAGFMRAPVRSRFCVEETSTRLGGHVRHGSVMSPGVVLRGPVTGETMANGHEDRCGLADDPGCISKASRQMSQASPQEGRSLRAAELGRRTFPEPSDRQALGATFPRPAPTS